MGSGLEGFHLGVPGKHFSKRSVPEEEPCRGVGFKKKINAINLDVLKVKILRRLQQNKEAR